MKILFLSDDFPPASFGGAGVSTFELAKGIKKAGHEVFVVTTVRKKEESGETEFEGLKIFKIASSYHGRWRAYISLKNRPVVKKLEEILKEVKPDIVHANNIHFYISYYSLKLANKYAKAVVLTFRDVMSVSYDKLATEKYLKNFDTRLTWLDNLKQAKKRWNPFRNYIIKRYLRYADKLLSVSIALKKVLESNGIKNIEVLHTGIDLADYLVTSDASNNKTVFLAGRLNELKGARVMQDVMQRVKENVSDADLLTAGDSGEWLTRDEMKEAYSKVSVVIVPSVSFDSLPRVVLEAMAMAKPVVGTCFGGTPEAIVDGVTGYVINPFDTVLMTERIAELLRDPEKAKRFGEAGRKEIRINFNLDIQVKKLVNIYESLIKNVKS